MRKRTSALLAIVALASLSLAFKPDHVRLSWQMVSIGTDARLRGLSAVSSTVAWAGGSLGTVYRTVDGGQTWAEVGPSVPDKGDLLFRDVEAFDADHAVILAIGPGDFSRVYVTSDAGQHWTLGFVNDDPNAFYDCMSFFDREHGLVVSDPPDGRRFRIIATNDGGLSWHVVPADMPQALPGEFAFAASGQCLVTGKHDAWFASGGADQARVYHSRDGGLTWTVAATPVHSGPTAGIFALAFRNPRHGLAIGGDFLTPDAAPDSLALTKDGGQTWRLISSNAPNEYRSGATWVKGQVAIAVGPTGSDVTFDGGQTWRGIDDTSFDTVDCAKKRACWASGEAGNVGRLVWKH